MKDYWEMKKNYLTTKVKKDNPDKGLLNATDEFRKRQENAELMEKSTLHLETMGETVWRTNLRIYK